jgi:hypothetical protein
MCGLHHARGGEELGFIGLALKLGSMVSPCLASKPLATVSPNLASKSVTTIFVVWPQNHLLGFPGLGLKTGRCGLVIWPTKSPQRFLRLCLKTKWAMVCRLRLKTNGRMKMV